MNNSVKMDSLPTLQLPTSFFMSMQKLPHNLLLNYIITPNAGRPQASRRGGAAKEKRSQNRIPQIPRLGGDMKLRFSIILKRNTDTHKRTGTNTHKDIHPHHTCMQGNGARLTRLGGGLKVGRGTCSTAPSSPILCCPALPRSSKSSQSSSSATRLH